MCGLFGYIGKDNKKFNFDKFNILGIFNDTRGGDSCGKYNPSDGPFYGVDKFKLFRDLVISHKNGDITEIDCTVLGHCRKATVGAHTLQNAQPVVLGSGKQNELEDFVMVHNGTLINHEELAVKYNLKDAKTETDSKTLAKLIEQEGFNILTEYNGAAALVIYDLREYKVSGDHVVYIFRGKSKASNTSVLLEEERPLYLLNISEDYHYFSSIKESLSFIAEDTDNEIDPIEEIIPNILYKFVNGVLISKTNYDRSANYQKKFVSSYVGTEYGEEDYWEENNFYNKRYYRQEFKKKEETKEVKLVPEHSNSLNTLKVPYNYEKDYRIDEEKSDNKTSEQINFTKGRYYIGDKLANGKIDFSEYGWATKSSYSVMYSGYFIDGVLMLNKDAYTLAMSVYTVTGCITYILPFIMEKFLYLLGNHFLSYDFENKELSYKNGAFHPLFTDKEYVIKEGELQKIGKFTTKNYVKDNRIGKSIYYSNLIVGAKELTPGFFKKDFADLEDMVEYYFGKDSIKTFYATVISNLELELDVLKSESYSLLETNKLYFEELLDNCKNCLGSDTLIEEIETIINTFNKTLTKLD